MFENGIQCHVKVKKTGNSIHDSTVTPQRNWNAIPYHTQIQHMTSTVNLHFLSWLRIFFLPMPQVLFHLSVSYCICSCLSATSNHRGWASLHFLRYISNDYKNQNRNKQKVNVYPGKGLLKWKQFISTKIIGVYISLKDMCSEGRMINLKLWWMIAQKQEFKDSFIRNLSRHCTHSDLGRGH